MSACANLAGGIIPNQHPAQSVLEWLHAKSRPPPPTNPAKLKAVILQKLKLEHPDVHEMHWNITVITEEEAREALWEKGRSIRKLFAQLRMDCESLFPAAQGEWRQCGPEERKQLLNDAWGQKMDATLQDALLESEARTLFLDYLGSPRRHVKTDELADPSMNHETLCANMALFDFLRQRAEFTPAHFARRDLSSGAPSFKARICAEQVMFVAGHLYTACNLDDRGGPDTYGELFVGLEAQEMLRSARHPCLSDAWNVLLRQGRLYTFALRILGRILERVAARVNCGDAITCVSSVGGSECRAASWTEGSTLEFLPPWTMERLQNWIQNQINAAVEQIRHLRREPHTFAEVWIGREQRDLKLSSLNETARKEARMSIALRKVQAPFDDLDMWNTLELLAKNATNCQNENDRYDAVVKLRVTVHLMLVGRIVRFIECGKRSSKLYWLFHDDRRREERIKYYREKSAASMDVNDTVSMYALLMVWIMEHHRPKDYCVNYLPLLYGLISNSDNVRGGMFPEYLLDMLEQIGPLCECLRQTDPLERWRPVEESAIKSHLKLLKKCYKSQARNPQFLESHQAPWWQKEMPAKSPFCEELRRYVLCYDNGGRSSKKRMENHLRAKERLKAFWKHFHEQFADLPEHLKIDFADEEVHTQSLSPRSDEPVRLTGKHPTPIASHAELVPSTTSAEKTNDQQGHNAPEDKSDKREEGATIQDDEQYETKNGGHEKAGMGKEQKDETQGKKDQDKKTHACKEQQREEKRQKPKTKVKTRPKNGRPTNKEQGVAPVDADGQVPAFDTQQSVIRVGQDTHEVLMRFFSASGQKLTSQPLKFEDLRAAIQDTACESAQTMLESRQPSKKYLNFKEICDLRRELRALEVTPERLVVRH